MLEFEWQILGHISFARFALPMLPSDLQKPCQHLLLATFPLPRDL
ncbi:hypothetical protein D082_03440 [Synechocystis sp. PCC 6714]|nr:hypothetical protein D082_03440 [Synechocystis sp. PCC 6714]